MVASSRGDLIGSCSSDHRCTAEVPVGTTLKLFAKASVGSVGEWHAPCAEESGTTCTLTLDQAGKTVNATAVSARLTLQVSGGTLGDEKIGDVAAPDDVHV